MEYRLPDGEIYEIDDEFGPLTGKQAAFVEEYVRDFNGTRAAERAGYKGSDNVLSSVAYENLRKPKIAEAIRKRLRSLVLNTDQVLAMLRDQALGTGLDYLLSTDDLDLERVKREGKGYLIKSVTTYKTGSVKIEFYDSQKALELIGRHLAMFTDRTQIEGKLSLDLGELSDAELEAIAARGGG